MLPLCQTQASLFILQDRCQVRLDGSPSGVGRRGQSQGHDQQQALPVNARVRWSMMVQPKACLLI